MIRTTHVRKFKPSGAIKVISAKDKWTLDKSYMARECALDTVKGYYRAIDNEQLYMRYAAEFNGCDGNPKKLNALIKDVFETAGFGYVYEAADTEEKKYFNLAFQEFFRKASTKNTQREAVDRDVVVEMCYQQNFRCPVCGGKLDPDVKSGPLKVVADHCTAISKIGESKDTLTQLYGENAVGIAAIHQHCNSIKGDNPYLSGYVENLK